MRAWMSSVIEVVFTANTLATRTADSKAALGIGLTSVERGGNRISGSEVTTKKQSQDASKRAYLLHDHAFDFLDLQDPTSNGRELCPLLFRLLQFIETIEDGGNFWCCLLHERS